MSGSQGLEGRNCSWHPLRARKSGGLPPGCCALVGRVLTGDYLMATAAPNSGFTTLLKKKNFLRLWLAQLISQPILLASNYPIFVLKEKNTGSTTLEELPIICFSLPPLT